MRSPLSLKPLCTKNTPKTYRDGLFEEFEQLLIYAIALQTLHKVISFEHALSFLLHAYAEFDWSVLAV